MKIFVLSCLLVAASAALVPQSQHRLTRDVSELEAPTNDYLPPENDLEATSEVITEAPSLKSLDTDSSAALGDKGYEYRSIRRLKYRLRNRRDVSHLIPSNHYLPPNHEYLPPTPESQPENDSEEIISTGEVAPKVSNEYLPPGEEPEVAPETSSEEVPEEMTTLAADSEIVEAASLKSVDGSDAEDSEVVDIPAEEVAQDTAILAEDGYHYKRPEESSMLKMVSPVGEYLPPVVEEVMEAVGPEESALLADDGYHYRVIRRFRF